MPPGRTTSTSSLWRMTFGFAPRIEWDARIKGRGVVGVGEAADLIHHAQLAWMPAAERRRYALTGPRPRAAGSSRGPAGVRSRCPGVIRTAGASTGTG